MNAWLWSRYLRRLWEQRLDRLDAYLARQQARTVDGQDGNGAKPPGRKHGGPRGCPPAPCTP